MGLVVVIVKVIYDFILFIVCSIEWLKYVLLVCFSYYLVVVLLFEKNIKKKNILCFEILRMNIFIIEMVLFWLIVGIKFFFVFFELLF